MILEKLYPISAVKGLSDPWRPKKSSKSKYFTGEEDDVDYALHRWGNRKNIFFPRHALSMPANCTNSCQLKVSTLCKPRRMGDFRHFASTDDGVTVNGSPQTSTSVDALEEGVKLNQSLQYDHSSDRYLQSLHDTARIFELAITEQSMLYKKSWLPTSWLGIDRNAWVKVLSYQASIYSLLQAAIEISRRGDERDRVANIVVHNSLLRLSSSLEVVIRDKLSANLSEAYDWFWSEQIPAVVTNFVNYAERDTSFNATSTLGRKDMYPSSGNASDISLLMLALTCTAAVMKLGPAKISSSQFFSMIPDTTGRLMDMLVDFIPIRQAYLSLKAIGLRKEFLVHFGPRAAASKVTDDCGREEVVFWVELVQKQLQQAIDREKIWSRLTTSESIEILEKDLAVFGFFIALGRSTKCFLSVNGFGDVDAPIEGLLRYLIGGSVLYYPQLSSISSYQIYVEVVTEELDWLPFYPGSVGTLQQSHGHKSRKEGNPNLAAIPQAIDVCSHWMQSFIKYSKWLEDPSNIKAATFLSRGHIKLMDCMEELGIRRSKMAENNGTNYVEKTSSETYPVTGREPIYFDKALESVEEALIRLEGLLQELHVSRSNSGKEHLKAACSDLEKIRKLKKEAEFLEASCRAKTHSLQQEEKFSLTQPSTEQPQFLKREKKRNAKTMQDARSRGLWSVMARLSFRKPDLESPIKDGIEAEPFDVPSAKMDIDDSETSEARRFESLRKELKELEERVKRSAGTSCCKEDIKVTKDGAAHSIGSSGAQLIQTHRKENVVEKSLDKLKEVSTDVLQGTQLLAIDVAAAMGLLRRALIGDELTLKEKQALRRTLSDLASVVPISILMLLPVTAVGHAAMLAAIQRYVPSLIPSTYGADRLDLLRQLEKVKELETCELGPEDVED